MYFRKKKAPDTAVGKLEGIASVAVAGNLHSALWSVAAYTVILCFSLFKTGSLSKSIFNAH